VRPVALGRIYFRLLQVEMLSKLKQNHGNIATTRSAYRPVPTQGSKITSQFGFGITLIDISKSGDSKGIIRRKQDIQGKDLDHFYLFSILGTPRQNHGLAKLGVIRLCRHWRKNYSKNRRN
jgi:hypothetical protein